MATYYRWRQSNIQYKQVESLAGSLQITVYSGLSSSETFYWASSINISNGSIQLVGKESLTVYDGYAGIQRGAGYIETPDGAVYRIIKTANLRLEKASGSNSYITTLYYVNSSGDNSIYSVSTEAAQGSFVGYVYAINSNAHPNGGISGSYYYDQRTTIISPTAPAGITYPATITALSVSISWTAATSNISNFPVASYEVSYSTNGGTSWTVAGTTESTSYSFDIPAGTTSVMFRVRARDTNNQYGDYVTGTASQVLIAPTLTVPQMVMQGQSATISWSEVEGADSYTLQRKSSEDADWTQVYSGADLSYTETVGTWTSLQYRVQAVFDDTPGGWATSGEIQIVSASALVISGSDGDLGTLTNDVQYSVSSDGSNALTVTESVNGTETRTFTATNGATNKIHVVDLPTGYGTIKITASTNPGSGVVTVTRNWTYSKTAPTFANAGSTAQLQQNGKNIFPLTLLECVRGGENLAPGGFGLGTSNPRHIDDANNALESGWYYLDASTLNGPESAEYSNVMLVLTRNSNPQTVQVSFNVTDLAFELRRVCTNGVWSPWEWVNPPMQLGVEYRTTERYSNKPVFVMAVDGGVFPDSSSKTIDVQIPDTSGRVKMLDCYGVLDNGTQIPGLFGESVFNASNYLGLFTQNGNGKFTISVGSGRTVGLNFTLFLKYWKEGT